MNLKKFLCLALLFLTGCYAMPNEYDYCVVPSTNNPDFTGGRTTPSSSMPQMPSIPGGF